MRICGPRSGPSSWPCSWWGSASSWRAARRASTARADRRRRTATRLLTPRGRRKTAPHLKQGGSRIVAEQLWRREALAAYATLPWQSRGRWHREPEGPSRSPFQRDRDRIIHSTAFRRLKHKTQVFVYHEGDHYRTRLTHSLEVAQIARTICPTLRLDEDLRDAAALAHALGHTPFRP